MTKTRKILTFLLHLLIWAAIAAYFVFAVRECRTRHDSLTIQRVDIVVRDSSSMSFVTSEMVREWFRAGGMDFRGKPVGEIHTSEVERFLCGKGFVKSAEVYTDIDGTMTIELTQRKPFLRVLAAGGYDFFVTDDGYILPARSRTARYVPVVTGSFAPPFEPGFEGNFANKAEIEEKNSDKNYLFFSKLVNFAKLVECDDFWSSQIVQIEASADGSIELIPRAGNHVILFGSPDDGERKLEKLRLFYRNALAWEGWNTWHNIDIRYDNQIVCTK